MKLRARSGPWRETEPAVVDGAYRPVSYWQSTVDVAPGEPLAGDTDCDVAVIGGGYTGLSTACELAAAAPDLDVVLLERDVVGHGASGRNGGFAMPLLGWSLGETVAKLGDERAAAAYRVMYDAVAHTVGVIRDEAIDCDLEQTGYVLLATSPARERHVRHEAELGDRLGFGYRLLERDALGEYVASDAFSCGCFDPNTAVVNPAKLARGLGALAARRGVRVFERTPVEAVDDGDPVAVRTPGGVVRARAVVLALNAYGAALGFMPNRVLPVHTYIVLTEPIDGERLDAIGWRAKRASLETSRNFIHYFRLTADDRILFGGHDAKLFWGGRYRNEDAACFAGLEATLRDFFPPLADVAVEHRWGGIVGVTLDMFPSFGAGGARGAIFHGGGYSGHGVALASYAGRILAPRVLVALGREAPVVEPPLPFGRLPPWLPPDPLRYLGMQAYRAALHLQDRWQRS